MIPYDVLSMMQPWATLLVLGIKKVETRSWSTKPRRNLLIHASAKWSKEGIALLTEDWFIRDVVPVLRKHGINQPTDFPLGKIIGAVDVVGCYPAWRGIFNNGPIELLGSSDPTADDFLLAPSVRIEGLELLLGDYTSSNRRKGWVCENPRQLVNPIPAKGKLSVWEYEAESPLTFMKM